jgi:D-psicose/D-tagatose/L-ribulose 3-epimerase
MKGIGVHSLLWSFEWSNAVADRVFPEAAARGIPFIEFCIADTERLDTAHVRALSEKHGVGVVCSPGLTQALHPPANPDGAVAFLMAAAERAAECGSSMLCGVTYGTIGRLTGKAPTAKELDAVARVLERTAAHARTFDVEIGLEAINRYETYVINTAAQAVSMIERVGAPNLFVHLDTFHVNSEERSWTDAIVTAGAHLKYLHLSESHRGVPGTGTVAWDELFAALAAIGFQGILALEAFVDPPEHLVEALRFWRSVAPSREALLNEGLAFLRGKAATHGLI